jgi:glycosyltransferase involved in cell wall biosynthesis
VIIPTHDRFASVRRTLDTLGVQSFPGREFEVVVVADGCTDGTPERLRQYEPSFPLRVIEQPGQGAASARNHGAALATGRLLVFLDDDIDASPRLIEAHVRVHQAKRGRVVIGYLPPVLESPLDFFRIQLRNWWEDRFNAMRRPGHRFSYRDLLSGNFSLEAETFASVGGFDSTFPGCGGEDWELGVRLINAGASFVFAADAVGYHHDNSSLDRAFRRKYQEGRADVITGHRHPELRPLLSLAGFGTRTRPRQRLLRALAFSDPPAGDAVAARLRPALALLEWARMRGRWRQLCGDLNAYWYWRGVQHELGTRRALASFLQGSPAKNADGPEIEIDLRDGLKAAVERFDEVRPASVHFVYGDQPVGCVPTRPGSERLRGAHLAPLLATEMAVPLLTALALELALGKSTAVDPLFTNHRGRSLRDNHAGKSLRR